jgi:NAD(P)-dependent dehydrogenase (short-subunit alcohol dehydrogenase family)
MIATARDPQQIAALANQYPDTCRTLALDVADEPRVTAAVAEASAIFGRLDVLVNNAGYGLAGAFEELDREQIAQNFATNFFGALAVIRAALPIFRAQGNGHIVNISAAAAIANYPGLSIYGATKWALEGVSESLAAELHPLGIKVTIVQPGPFRTDFIGRSMDTARNSIADYDQTSGKFLRLLKAVHGKQPGDPARAAEAIIAIVNADAPPLRLVLGKYAQDKLRKKLKATEAEHAQWEAIGRETAFL